MPGKRLLELEDLIHLTLVSSPRTDAEGRRVFFLVTRMSLERDRYESTIWVYDTTNGRAFAVTGGPMDRSPTPSPSGRRLAFLSKRRLGEKERGQEVWVLDLESREPRLAAIMPLGVSWLEWSPDEKRLLLVAQEGVVEDDVKHIEDLPVWFNDVGFVYSVDTHLYIMDPDSGEYVRVTDGRVQVRSASWSPDGGRIAYLVSRDRLKPYLVDIYIYDVARDEHYVVVEGFTSYHHVVWSPDGKYLAFIGHRRPRGLTSHNRVWLVSLDGNEVECLTCNLDRNTVNTLNSDVRGPSNTPPIQWAGDGWIYFLVTDHGSTILYRVKPGSEPEKVYQVEKGVIDEFTVADKTSLIAFTAMKPTMPKELYLLRDGEAERVTSFNDFFLSRVELTEPQHFTFKASDGETIDGWVLLPPEKARKGDEIPWVLYIHGGPKTAYGWSFIEEFHYLASRGLAIVYTNPRGSDGYSEEFADIRGKYGERDYMDLMEAVDAALEKYPMLSKARIGVAGGSYGGFMVNWIITHTSRFQAAVTQRSISDWISMYGTTDIGHYFVEDQIQCTPWRNPEKCLEKSPVRYAANAKTPTLIIHSMEDYRCWLDQALILFTALRKNNVKTRLVVFPGESHELSRRGKPKHRLERLKEIAEWLTKHLQEEQEKAARRGD